MSTSRASRLGWWPLVVSLVAAAPGPRTAWGAAPKAPDQAGILYVESSEPSRPAALALLRGVRVGLGENDRPSPLYVEALDLYRFHDEDQERLYRDFLRRRYRDRPIGAILVSGDPAARLVLEWDDSPWAGVPVVALTVDPGPVARARERGGVTGLAVRIDAEGTLDAALALFPTTKQVAIVAGGDPYLGVLEEALSRRPSLGVIRLVDLPLGETRRRLAALPPDSIVLHGALFLDATGRGLTPQTALEMLARTANRPVFGYLETYLGHGLVGGSLLDLELIGREGGRLVRRVRAGESPGSIPVVETRASRLLFDGRELERWGVSDARLPPGSTVLLREPSIWQAHRLPALVGLVAIAIQTALIAALFLEVRRRQRAQKQLRELSARLVSAQEQERSRIARELHDDVNQRLALFAIELDRLGADGRRPPGEVREEMRALSVRARALSTDVHRIAYELHPAILDQLGLVPALRRFAGDLSRHHGLTVTLKVEGWPDDLPRSVTLAFYRVCQEALRNVVRHSGARETAVVLRRTSSHLTLTVNDDGRGFRPARRGSHLGLVGMRERLRQIGGQLVVESFPEKGTLVAATLPVEVVAPHGPDERRAGSPGTPSEPGETRAETPTAAR